jgi:hypothetical protein
MYYPDQFERPLYGADIEAIAGYLDGTDEDLEIALSELGFDPCLYEETQLRRWLEEEAGLAQCERTGVWRRIMS